MKLPVQAIGSFQRQCQEDIDQIWAFMEDKTPADFRSSHSIRILGGFRNTLWLQFSQMSRAWHNYKPDDSDVSIQTLARIGTIVESTRIADTHVLKVSGDALSEGLSWRSDAPSDPNPYTSLSQFHQTVMPSAHPDSPLARKLPILAARRVGLVTCRPHLVVDDPTISRVQ